MFQKNGSHQNSKSPAPFAKDKCYRSYIHKLNTRPHECNTSVIQNCE